MSNYVFPKALKTYSDGEAAKARKKQPFDPDKPRYEGLPKRRVSDNKRPQQALHIYHLRQASTDEQIVADLKQFSGLSDAADEDIYFRRLKDPQFAIVVFPDVEAARNAKLRMEHGEFDWTLRKKKEHEEGFFADKAATGFKADFVTKKKALEIERIDNEARAGGVIQINAARSSTPPPSSSKQELSSEQAVHYKVDAIREALDLPNLGNDAARSMTVASQLFMEELLQRAAFEAERDGSATLGCSSGSRTTITRDHWATLVDGLQSGAVRDLLFFGVDFSALNDDALLVAVGCRSLQSLVVRRNVVPCGFVADELLRSGVANGLHHLRISANRSDPPRCFSDAAVLDFFFLGDVAPGCQPRMLVLEGSGLTEEFFAKFLERLRTSTARPSGSLEFHGGPVKQRGLSTYAYCRSPSGLSCYPKYRFPSMIDDGNASYEVGLYERSSMMQTWFGLARRSSS